MRHFIDELQLACVTQKSFHTPSSFQRARYLPIIQNPLWKMIERLMHCGYRSDYESIYLKLPDELQHSLAGESFNAEMKDSEVLKIGNIFPSVMLENINKVLVSMNRNLLENQYTLVDFCFQAYLMLN